MFGPLLGGTGRHPRQTRLRALTAGVLALALAAALAACGESSSDSNEPTGTFQIAVTEASFPTKQSLGQNSQLKLAVRNEGERTVPSLVVTFTIGGKAGRQSSLPFGLRDAQTGLASADRPVWVLAQGYPRLADDTEAPGGATTANRKTFAFGPLKPGEETAAVWKLSAVKAGEYTLLYRVGAGLGEQKAETEGGVAPGGSFVAEISSELPEVEVNDAGEVVEIPAQKGTDGAAAE
jgi:hypothetical protein